MILLNVLRDIKPECIAVAFDLPGKTKRHDQYAAYKAHRVAAPSDLISQFGRVREVAEAFNIPVYTAEGYEADDVIGSISKQAPKEVETIIVTGDMDELQLVDHKTKVYTMKRGFTDTIIYDEVAVKEKYGLTPTEFIDYKALKGDPSDNIPGVSGIGEKTATSLIGEFGSLENVYANLEKINPKVAAKLEAEKETAFLSKELSTIKTDLDVGFVLEKCYVHDYNRNEVFDLFQKFGFKSLLSKLPESRQLDENGEKPHHHIEKTNYKLITSQKDLDALISTLKEQNCIAVDTETDSIDQIKANLVGISISYKEGASFYIPVGHNNCTQLKKIEVIKQLKTILEDSKIKKVGHNLKYDYAILKKEGVILGPIYFDTMIAAYLLNPNARAQKLEELAFNELGIEMIKITEVIGKGKEEICFADGELEKCKTYACEDADISLRLYHKLSKELEAADMKTLMATIEAPLIPVLAEMELNGIKLDSNKLNLASKEFSERLLRLESEIVERAGRSFNIASPGQLQEVLFGTLKLDEKVEDKRDLKKLKSGSYSTAASELEKLRGLDPIIEQIFEFRELSKLKNTYIDVLPALVDARGRVHTSYNQAITQTGRLSSSEPNLQNIPIRSKEGKRIREAFIPDSGCVLMSADYSQIELRVIAHLAGDETMIKIFNEGRDIHSETAAAVYGVSEDSVTPEIRRVAKIINFGIIYGVSAHGLKQQTGMTREEGKNLIEKYFTVHPKIKKYTEEMVTQAHELGYVETLFGRRRYLPEIKSSNFAVRGAAERMAINMPVQGTAADLMKLAMIDINATLNDICPSAKILLQVHDEIVLEVPEKEAQKVAQFIKEKMDNVVHLSVPIETAVHWGQNWEAAKE
jgi:DNA polymerase I